MPKAKTHAGASKRIHITGSGKFKVKSNGKRHNLRKKTTKQKRHLNIGKVLGETERDRVSLMLNAPRSYRRSTYVRKALREAQAQAQ